MVHHFVDEGGESSKGDAAGAHGLRSSTAGQHPPSSTPSIDGVVDVVLCSDLHRLPHQHSSVSQPHAHLQFHLVQDMPQLKDQIGSTLQIHAPCAERHFTFSITHSDPANSAPTVPKPFA